MVTASSSESHWTGRKGRSPVLLVWYLRSMAEEVPYTGQHQLTVMPPQHEALVTPAPYTEPELQDVPTPQPASGQILVKNLVAGIMPADWKVPAWGMWDDSYPMVLGFDGAGVVEEVGPNVTGFTEGDRV